jgi:superfamily II DNA or RNA helicase
VSELYVNPQGLYPFQGQLVARSYLRGGNLAVVDAGLGKSHIALALAALLVKDGMIDQTLLVCEQNKLDEWMDDIARFTLLRPSLFHGPKRKFTNDADIVVSTYTTMRDSFADPDPRDNRLLIPGEGIEFFTGKRMLVIYDEMAMLAATMTSRTYQSHELAINHWRHHGGVRILGLTATPMSTTPVCFYNLGCLIAPESMGTYVQFCRDFVSGYDRWGRPSKFVYLDVLEERLSTFMLRKRKTDPDVIDQFPKMVEKPVYLTLPKDHAAAYESFEAFVQQAPERDQLPAFRTLNAFAAHPRSVLASGWKVAIDWVDSYGAERIKKIHAIKSQATCGYLSEIAHQGASAIVFCDSVKALRALAEDIAALPDKHRFSFVEYHGQQSDAQNRDAKAKFKSGDATVLLASSKAERGINLPEASYIVNFDVPARHSSYLQRASRGSRIGSNVDGILVIKTFITRDTIERSTVRMWQRRNEWSDRLQDPRAYTDPNFISSYHRLLMLREAQLTEDPSCLSSQLVDSTSAP